ncbi:MAG: glycosyltransferase [Bacteroidetes bacterium]|nr:glycosyltransferase [Bacteroidota bacterium]
MKILWFTNTPANGIEYLGKELSGTGGWLQSLDREIQNSVELFVVYHGGNNMSFTNRKTKYISVSHKVSIWSKIFSRSRLKSQSFLLEKYLSIIEKVNPDLIHIHGTENHFGIIIKHVKCPIVVSMQGIVNVYEHKFFSGLERKYIRFGDKFFNEFNWLRSLLNYEIDTLENAKYIIGRTEWDRRVTLTINRNRQYYHVDEILRDSFYENNWKSSKMPDRIRIVSTTSNTYYKGLETICNSLYLLIKMGMEVEWSIIGVNEKDLIVKRVKKSLGKKYPMSSIRYCGRLSESNLVSILLSSDLYVMASHIENSPNNLCEAMALGMPTISSFVGGVGSLVIGNVSGILLQDGDPWSLAGSICELSNDWELACTLGSKGRDVALKRHSKNKIVKDILKLYMDLIELKSININR